MNQLQKCHQFEGCTDIFIDAFRALKHKTSDSNNAFILTHYHADHYSGLPRGDAYTGPARIHCTPVTANLLREIHRIDSKWIVPHEYDETWNHNGNEVTFFDANHCPGAAIVLVKVNSRQNKQSSSSSATGAPTNHHQCTNKNGNNHRQLQLSSTNINCRYHLHTGDMRFNRLKFESYPLLRQIIQNRQLDILYLDTTYAKPKHTFLPQEEAIQTIASQVNQLIQSNNDIVHQKKASFFQPRRTTTTTSSPSNTKKDPSSPPSSNIDDDSTDGRTLVLLSCYSIGKERVLWQSVVQSNQLVYCNSTKQRMLRCIECNKHVDESNGIIEKCTSDAQKSDIHVITMGTAGTLHPYFQANFTECALYAHRQNKGYRKVVAFIPTGWADSSKYNKEHPIASKMVDLREIVNGSKINGNHHLMKVEVRLVAYSEHSSYTELRDCVAFMKPRRLIPTVFSGEKDYLAIEKRFQDLIDSQRAKQAFINTIGGSSSLSSSHTITTTSSISSESRNSRSNDASKGMKRKAESEISSSTNQTKKNHQQSTLITIRRNKEMKGSFNTNTTKDSSKVERHRHHPISKSTTLNTDDSKVAQLVFMGFSAKRATEGLLAKNNNLESAIEYLLSS